jgi:hypothetical protein
MSQSILRIDGSFFKIRKNCLNGQIKIYAGGPSRTHDPKTRAAARVLNQQDNRYFTLYFHYEIFLLVLSPVFFRLCARTN